MTFIGKERMGYETPPGGISLTRYITRRMHKTRLLKKIETLHAPEKLAQFAIYAAAAATSWGPAMYQPRFDRPGTIIEESDPDTGAIIRVEQCERNPHYQFNYTVEMPDGAKITGQESILGTTVGLRGLGMPAPSFYEYLSADEQYHATARGVINSELVPGFLFTSTKVRGYGDLDIADNQGYSGTLRLTRSAEMIIQIVEGDTPALDMHYQLN